MSDYLLEALGLCLVVLWGTAFGVIIYEKWFM